VARKARAAPSSGVPSTSGLPSMSSNDPATSRPQAATVPPPSDLTPTTADRAPSPRLHLVLGLRRWIRLARVLSMFLVKPTLAPRSRNAVVPCVQQLPSGCPALAFHAAGSKSRLSQSHISNFLYAYIHTETSQKPPDFCSIMKYIFVYLHIETSRKRDPSPL